MKLDGQLDHEVVQLILFVVTVHQILTGVIKLL